MSGECEDVILLHKFRSFEVRKMHGISTHLSDNLFSAIPGNLWVAIDEEHGSCTWGSAPDPEVFQGMGVSSELSDAPVQARMGGVQTGGGFMRLHHQR